KIHRQYIILLSENKNKTMKLQKIYYLLGECSNKFTIKGIIRQFEEGVFLLDMDVLNLFKKMLKWLDEKIKRKSSGRLAQKELEMLLEIGEFKKLWIEFLDQTQTSQDEFMINYRLDGSILYQQQIPSLIAYCNDPDRSQHYLRDRYKYLKNEADNNNTIEQTENTNQLQNHQTIKFEMQIEKELEFQAFFESDDRYYI
ncbi:hypothetical protein pb186bvf_020123, partial [Paramecium bursaria]